MTKDNTTLVEENKYLAYHVASRFYTGNPFDDDDIRQIALIGLWKAAKTWDETKSAFSTYATKVITNDLLQDIRKRNRTKRIGTVMSYDAIVETCEGDVTYLDMIASPSDDISLIELSADLPGIFDSLSDREKTLIDIYVSHPDFTQEEVAKQMHVTQARISRLMKKVRQKLLAY